MYTYVLASFAQHYVYAIQPLLLQTAVLCSFSLPYCTLFYKYTTVCHAVDGHWGYFHFVVIINNAAVGILKHVFWWACVHLSARYVPGWNHWLYYETCCSGYWQTYF